MKLHVQSLYIFDISVLLYNQNNLPCTDNIYIITLLYCMLLVILVFHWIGECASILCWQKLGMIDLILCLKIKKFPFTAFATT